MAAHTTAIAIRLPNGFMMNSLLSSIYNLIYISQLYTNMIYINRINAQEALVEKTM